MFETVFGNMAYFLKTSKTSNIKDNENKLKQYYRHKHRDQKMTLHKAQEY